ncbi:unnamed protein product [Linum trigynum]|uniref:Uncharacterized protein n=1 Tax=Linum trigynum TaxID=586398 RepID=A0AAV2CSL4_9ROSI
MHKDEQVKENPNISYQSLKANFPSWLNQHVTPPHVYDVPEKEEGEVNDPVYASEAFQQEESGVGNVIQVQDTELDDLNRANEAPTMFKMPPRPEKKARTGKQPMTVSERVTRSHPARSVENAGSSYMGPLRSPIKKCRSPRGKGRSKRGEGVSPMDGGRSPRGEGVSLRGEDRVSPRVTRRTTEPIEEIDENADNTAKSMPEQPEKTEVGVVARMMAPIRKYYWNELDDEVKHPMFVKLESEFVFALATEEVRKALDKKLHKHFLNYKYTCHKHYKEQEDLAKARLNRPEGVKQEDWEALCEHCESDRFKGWSTNNIQNKAKQQYAQTSGEKSTTREYDQDAEDNDAVPVDIELYANTHKKASDGTWVSEEPKANYVSPSAPLILCT